MKYLRTPPECFTKLPDYDFKEHYVVVDKTNGLRMHYVDAYSSDKEKSTQPIILMMHGEPSWSFLYRHMISLGVNAGYRVIAPDLIGFGKSDKPTEKSDYTFANHLAWLNKWLTELNLQDINLVCQDWGGLLGLRLVAQHPKKFASVVAANTFLPTGDEGASDDFKQWQAFSQQVPVFPVGQVIQKATVSTLDDNVIAAYDAPFPDESYKAGVRQFPLLVPITPDNPESENNREAWRVLSEFDKPFLTLFSDSDPITRGAEKAIQQRIVGCKGQAHQIIEGGGHFLQEDVYVQLMKKILAFLK